MAQGIRRTGLEQAKTRDPFEALLKIDATRMDKNFRGEQAGLQRDFKRGMFDEEMGLNRDKFNETLSQNDIANANAAARLGLAQRAASQVDPNLWLKKARYKHAGDMALAKLKNKGYGGKGGGYQNSAVYKNMDPDAQGRMDQDFATYTADPNVSYKDASQKVLNDAHKSNFLNPFEDTFYYD